MGSSAGTMKGRSATVGTMTMPVTHGEGAKVTPLVAAVGPPPGLLGQESVLRQPVALDGGQGIGCKVEEDAARPVMQDREKLGFQRIRLRSKHAIDRPPRRAVDPSPR